MASNRRRLIEALMMSDTGDERSYDEIYGTNGVADDEAEDTSLTSADAAAIDLSADDIEQLKSLAHQILQILGDDGVADDETALAGDSTDDGAVLSDSTSDDADADIE